MARRRRDVSEPQVNVDHFSHRPVCTVVGLLTDSARVDVAAVEILCGEQGARILDARGRYHGLRGRVVRTLQGFGYDLGGPRGALRKGDLLLHMPARPADSSRIAALLQRHGVHDLGYCGPGTFEQFPSSMGTGPHLTRNSRPFRRLVRPGPRAVPAACLSGGHTRTIARHARCNRHC